MVCRLQKVGAFSEDQDLIPGLDELVAWMEETWGRPVVIESLVLRNKDGSEIRMEPEPEDVTA